MLDHFAYLDYTKIYKINIFLYPVCIAACGGVEVSLSIGMILLLAAGLSMDAFAVSVTNGMSCRMKLLKNALYSGLAFGLAQGLMPLIGYFAGRTFAAVVERYDHWVALIFLGVIGAKMVIEAVKDLRRPDGTVSERGFSLKELVFQAIATSIDALAVGVSLGVMKVNIALAVSVIAAVTFAFSFSGVFVGKKFGQLFKEKAAILGGVILILIGMRIFLQHTGIIG